MTQNTTPTTIVRNTFRTPGHKRAGCPYRIQNGNYGFYFPKKFFGLITSGRAMIVDLKTTDLRQAQDRIDACALWVQLSTCKKATF